MASRAIGELVRKLGERVLPSVVPILSAGLKDPNPATRQRQVGRWVRVLPSLLNLCCPQLCPSLSAGLKDPNPATRQMSDPSMSSHHLSISSPPSISSHQSMPSKSFAVSPSWQGVCCGLGEVMNAAGRQNLTSHLDDLIGTIRTALCDEDAEVREAAAQAFSTLYKSAGMQAIDESVPTLLHSLNPTNKFYLPLPSPPISIRSAGMQAIDEIVPALLHSLELTSKLTNKLPPFFPLSPTPDAGMQAIDEIVPALLHSIKLTKKSNFPLSPPLLPSRSPQPQHPPTRSAGMQAIDEIVPALLHSLEDPRTSATALDGLKQILSVRTTVVLPHILPKLVKPPLTYVNWPEVKTHCPPCMYTLPFSSSPLLRLACPLPKEFKAHALGALAEVAGALRSTTSPTFPSRSHTLFPPPQGVQGTCTGEFKAHALGALAEVAGAGMCVHLATVLPPLLNEMGQMEESPLRSMAMASAEAVVKGVDEEGLDSLIGELTHALSDNSAVMRRGAAKLLGTFCKITRVDLEEELPSLMTILIVMLADPDEACVKVAWEALGSVTSTIPKESLPVHLKVVRDAVATARDRERRKRKVGSLPALAYGLPMLVADFCLPKGLQPVLQIYLQALMLGSAEMREAAADGLAELIDVASEAALRPFVVPITGSGQGVHCPQALTCPLRPSLSPISPPAALSTYPPSLSPLIRIVGDRFPWQVKAAILSTLAILISKGGIALKPFLPSNPFFLSPSSCLLGSTPLLPAPSSAYPLIRIVGDRFPWQVKAAILSTLAILITKGGIALKPFLPSF
ncbi:unnamed protein product [Closterium sp. Naga37s-1]|nr:unnamed protein product [Closterium sp. Naga37s-1]